MAKRTKKPTSKYSNKANKTFSSTDNPYTEIMTPTKYAEWRSALAKRANSRLASLEKASSKITGESYTYGAYKKYAADVLGMEKPRFSQSKVVKDVNTMRHEILVLQRFLNAKSSTISGNIEIEKKRIETFQSGKWGNIKFDINGKPTKSDRIKIIAASNKGFYDFLSSGLLNRKINPYFSSEKMIELYEQAMENGKEAEEIIEIITQALEEYAERTTPASLEDIERRLGITWLD